jgi:hypothetical protein
LGQARHSTSAGLSQLNDENLIFNTKSKNTKKYRPFG